MRRTIAAIDALSAVATVEEFDGFLTIPFRCRQALDHSGRTALHIEVSGYRYTRASGAYDVITLCWGIIEQLDDWYEPGWHPDARWYALKSPWPHRLRTALRQGTGET